MKTTHVRRIRRQFSVAGYSRSLLRTRVADATKSVALAFFATLTFAFPVRAAEEDPYPVWWSAELELDSLDRVEARLRRDLWLDFPEGLKLYKAQGTGHVTAQARNCNSLRKLSQEGYYGSNSSDIGVQHYHRSVCRAIALLGQAKPARTSHLRGFVLNAEAVRYLPALVNLQPSCHSICQAYFKNKRGVPLTDFEDIERVEVTNEDKLIVWTPGWRVKMSLIARGDFNSDGLDDILLVSHGGATEGTMRGADLYVLTRDGPGVVLQVLNAQEHLCPDYTGCR
jgi:hypothetical protein